MYSVIIEAGNCIYCGKHMDIGGSIFLCEECRRKEEERGCLHGRLKEADTSTVKLERPIMAREPRQKLINRGERSEHLRTGGMSAYINAEELLKWLDQYQEYAEDKHHWCDSEIVSDIITDIGNQIEEMCKGGAE